MPCVEEFAESLPDTRASSCDYRRENDEPRRPESHEPNRSLKSDQLQQAIMFVNPQVNGHGQHQRSFRSSDGKPEICSDGTVDPGPGPAGDSSDPMNPRVVLYPPHRIKLQWSLMRSIGAGLGNLGNTCYINSVLQCLTHTAPLVNYCLTDEHLNQCSAGKQKQFCLMCQFLLHIRKSLQKDNQVIHPSWVKQKTNENIIAKSFRLNRQEDAHEFLRVMVDGLQRACLNGFSKLDPYSRETTVVNQIFGGYLQSQVRCMKCSACFNTYDPYMDICLEIKDVRYLEEAFARFVKPETLDIDNAYKCERCLQKVNAEKRLSIFKESNVLTVQLKRFDYIHTAAKIKGHIVFSEKLNIKPYMSQSQGEPVWYRLYGVVVHAGAQSSCGHYYSYIKASDSTWYKMDDMNVHPVSSLTVFEDEAYVLFYVRDVLRQHNHLHRTSPANKGWEPAMRFNGVGNHHNGSVSNSMSGDLSGRYKPHSSSVNGAACRYTPLGSPINRGLSERYTPHGNPVSGTATRHHASYFTPVSGIGPQRLCNGNGVGDRGDFDVTWPQQGPSPRPLPQHTASMGTPLLMGHKKISFDLNKKRVHHNQTPGSQMKPQGNFHVNGMPRALKLKQNTEPLVNGMPKRSHAEQCNSDSVRIVFKIRNGTWTTDKTPDAKESVVKCSQTRKVPSKLVPYELDSDSEEGSSKRTDGESSRKDSSMDLPCHQDIPDSSFTWSSSRISQPKNDRSVSNQIDGQSEREKMCDQRRAPSAETSTIPWTNSGASADVQSTKSENMFFCSSEWDPFRGSRHARAGSIDKMTLFVKPNKKRSSSLEPLQRHSFERTAAADVFAFCGEKDTDCGKSVHESFSSNVQQFDHQSDRTEINRTKLDLSSGERHKKKKKKKHRKNRDRFSMTDGDGYRQHYKKHHRENEYSNSTYKDRWDRQQEPECKRQSELSYSDYEYQPSSAKRAKSPVSDLSEYEWTERTKESLQMEESAREKSHVRHHERDGDWNHSSMKPEGNDRYCNGTAWSHSHNEQRDWKKEGVKQWKLDNHHFSGRDRWREDYESHSQSSYYSGHNTPLSFSRPHSNDHQSGSYHPHNSGSSSSSSSHHSYYRDHTHNSFNSSSHYYGSRRSYGYQRRY